jgi:hypothetical protein
LEEFLLQQAVTGLLPISDLTVHDLDTWRKHAYDSGLKQPAEIAQRHSWVFLPRAQSRCYSMADMEGPPSKPRGTKASTRRAEDLKPFGA